MITQKNRHNSLFKVIAVGVACLFLGNQLTWAYPAGDALAAPTGLKQEEVVEALSAEARARYEAHNDLSDENSQDHFIHHAKRHTLVNNTGDPDETSTDYRTECNAIGEAFNEALREGGMGGLLGILANHGVERIQLAIAPRGRALNQFTGTEGEIVLGHASTRFLTGFVREEELLAIREGKKDEIIPLIIARLFHELRARSSVLEERAEELVRGNFSDRGAVAGRAREYIDSFNAENREIEKMVVAGRLEEVGKIFNAMNFNDVLVEDTLRDLAMAVPTEDSVSRDAAADGSQAAGSETQLITMADLWSLKRIIEIRKGLGEKLLLYVTVNRSEYELEVLDVLPEGLSVSDERNGSFASAIGESIRSDLPIIIGWPAFGGRITAIRGMPGPMFGRRPIHIATGDDFFQPHLAELRLEDLIPRLQFGRRFEAIDSDGERVILEVVSVDSGGLLLKGTVIDHGSLIAGGRGAVSSNTYKVSWNRIPARFRAISGLLPGYGRSFLPVASDESFLMKRNEPLFATREDLMRLASGTALTLLFREPVSGLTKGRQVTISTVDENGISFEYDKSADGPGAPKASGEGMAVTDLSPGILEWQWDSFERDVFMISGIPGAENNLVRVASQDEAVRAAATITRERLLEALENGATPIMFASDEKGDLVFIDLEAAVNVRVDAINNRIEFEEGAPAGKAARIYTIEIARVLAVSGIAGGTGFDMVIEGPRRVAVEADSQEVARIMASDQEFGETRRMAEELVDTIWKGYFGASGDMAGDLLRFRVPIDIILDLDYLPEGAQREALAASLNREDPVEQKKMLALVEELLSRRLPAASCRIQLSIGEDKDTLLSRAEGRAILITTDEKVRQMSEDDVRGRVIDITAVKPRKANGEYTDAQAIIAYAVIKAMMVRAAKAGRDITVFREPLLRLHETLAGTTLPDEAFDPAVLSRYSSMDSALSMVLGLPSAAPAFNDEQMKQLMEAEERRMRAA